MRRGGLAGGWGWGRDSRDGGAKRGLEGGGGWRAPPTVGAPRCSEASFQGRPWFKKQNFCPYLFLYGTFRLWLGLLPVGVFALRQAAVNVRACLLLFQSFFILVLREATAAGGLKTAAAEGV